MSRGLFAEAGAAPLELRKYAYNTARTYIQCFERFINHYQERLLYSAGLRRSELINLKITDIESDRMLIKISGAKGNKDRYTLLSQNLLKDLRAYYREYKPTEYLIEGPNGKKYSGTSIANIVKKAAQKAKIKKHVKPHMLRHSRVGGPICDTPARRGCRFKVYSGFNGT